MAAPVFVSASVDVGATIAGVTAPAGLVAGNLLIAIAYDSNTNGAAIFTASAPAGWTPLADWPDGGSGPGVMWVWTHTVGVSEPGSYAFSFNASGGHYVAAAVLQYSGTDGVDSVLVASNGASSASFVAPDVTATYSDDTLVCAFGSKNGRSVSSVPTGMTSRARDIQPGLPVGLDVCDKALSVSGATGTSTETLASADVGVVLSLLLRATGHTSGEIDLPLRWSATVAQDVRTTSWSGDDDAQWQLSLGWSCVIDLDPPDDVED